VFRRKKRKTNARHRHRDAPIRESSEDREQADDRADRRARDATRL
jgi:hypothetical protein